ncbi:MAG TPA: hypothetical protein ENI46_02960, partial [Firmicutes bacterium]|nr:hypothetical protein [Bacillota bacterium]
IDECGHTSFQGVMVFYAVPDENFLEGRAQIYEALKQRVSTVFEEMNPTGVKIELEQVSNEPVELLTEVGRKLRDIYEKAYDHRFDDSAVEETIRTVAERAYELRYGDIGYKRLFVQKVIRGFAYLKKKGHPPSVDDLQM